MDSVAGIVERVTFFSEDSGWSVLKLSPFGRSEKTITVTVHQAKVFAGATCEFLGEWTEHSKYGKQFKAQKYIEKKPASLAALEKYLGSGLIYGVGPKTAKKIVGHFKEKTLDIFETEIERLTEIEGIAKTKLNQISTAWQEHREIRNVMIFLQSHQISTLFAVKIYKKYGDKSCLIVQENPYQLSTDIYGIGFHSADKIAMSVGIGISDPRRIKAGIKHVLSGSREEGHCYLTLDQILKSVEELLNLPLSDQIPLLLNEMEEADEIKVRLYQLASKEEVQRCYYTKTLFFDELLVANKTRDFLKVARPIDQQRALTWVNKFNQAQKFPLSKEQTKSVIGVVSKSIAILTGGPGCGKTTTTKAIVKLALAMRKKVLLSAPTGRAAQRMEEVIGLPAKTLHRQLVWNPSTGGFKKNEEDPLDADLVIVDECSMLDISLSASLFKAIDENKTSLLLIGDQDQLPSVGAGNVLKDLIHSGEVPVFRLTEIFRQAKESLIIKFAHEINEGVPPRIDSPFRNPSLWKKGVDTLFIDSEEVTVDELKFIHRAKKVLKTKLEEQGESLVHIDDKKEGFLKKLAQQENSLDSEDIDLNQFDEQEGETLVKQAFKVPAKFQHVNLERLLNTENEISELKEVMKKVHPFSSLNYGIKASDMIVKLYKESIIKYHGHQTEIQILTPMTRGSMGTVSLNQKIQSECNPAGAEKKQLILGERIFRCGDRVIQKRNNYDLEVFNGDIGIVHDVDHGQNQLIINFPEKHDRLVTYKKEHMIELDLAYAITIHKSQGSEFDAVIIPVTTQHFKMLFRNLIYTGLTRAKKMLVFVGTRRALAMAVQNQDNKQRQTLLRELVIKKDIN